MLRDTNMSCLVIMSLLGRYAAGINIRVVTAEEAVSHVAADLCALQTNKFQS